MKVSAKQLFYPALMVTSVFVMQGCLATRDWVQERLDPVAGRVSQSEQRLNQAEGQIGSLGGRMTGAEGTLGQMDGRIGQVDAKTERALSTLANLRLERRFVIDMKEGANFSFNSSNLPTQAKKEIDGFISDLKGDAAGMDGAMFLVAGHTDNVGSEDYNYELGKKRADAVSRYLITQKKMDPLRVVTVSYGENAPMVENSSTQGRGKNRRVEILLYRDGITSAAAASSATPPAEPRAAQPPQQSAGERFSQR
jgi:outer membrane protein OmpA-like peptidoglycan-associated protein